MTKLSAAAADSIVTNGSLVGRDAQIECERAHLERNHLPLWKVSALGLAYMLIGPSSAMSAGTLIAFSAQASWLANLLSVVVVSLLAVVVSAYARRYVVTGSLVSYAYEALGARTRLFVAACMMLGYVALTATLILGVLTFTSSALLDLGIQGASNLPVECASAIVISLAAAAFACFGIDASVRVVVVLGFLCVPFVALAMGAALLELHPGMNVQLNFATVPNGGIVQGALTATGYYVGFDGIAALAVETKNPKRNVPRVLLGTVLTIGLAITACCFAQYPLLLAHVDELNAGASPVAICAHAIGWNWLALVVDLLLVPAAFAATVTIYNIGGRIIAHDRGGWSAASTYRPRASAIPCTSCSGRGACGRGNHSDGSAAASPENSAFAVVRLHGESDYVLLARAVSFRVYRNPPDSPPRRDARRRNNGCRVDIDRSTFVWWGRDVSQPSRCRNDVSAVSRPGDNRRCSARVSPHAP